MQPKLIKREQREIVSQNLQHKPILIPLLFDPQNKMMRLSLKRGLFSILLIFVVLFSCVQLGEMRHLKAEQWNDNNGLRLVFESLKGSTPGGGNPCSNIPGRTPGGHC